MTAEEVLGSNGEVFRLERGVRLETDRIAATTHETGANYAACRLGQRCKPSSLKPIGQKCSQLQQYCHRTWIGDIAWPSKSNAPKMWP